MSEELIFRIVFWVLILLILVFNRIIPAVKAKKSGAELWPDKEAIKNEGKAFFVFRVILGIVLFIFISIYSFYPPLNDMLQFHLPLWLRWFGTIVATIGVVFWIYSQEVLDRNWSGNLKIQKEHKLITTGPYGRIRHPIYTAMILWAIGLALFTANIFFALFAFLTIIFMTSRVSKEEKMLIEHFGDEYKNYMENAGRYFPRFKHYK